MIRFTDEGKAARTAVVSALVDSSPLLALSKDQAAHLQQLLHGISHPDRPGG